MERDLLPSPARVPVGEPRPGMGIMRGTFLKKCLLAAVGTSALAAGALSSPTAVGANSLGYAIHTIETGQGGEPSITAAGVSPTLSSPGELYEDSLTAAAVWRSTNQGAS